MNSSGIRINLSRIAKVEHIIEKILDQEEIFWKQRSRVNWLKHGDRNTKFSHATAFTQRKTNMIEGLVNSNDEWCSETQGMADITSECFSSLFSSSNPLPEDIETVMDFSDPVVDSHMNFFLCAPFNEA